MKDLNDYDFDLPQERHILTQCIFDMIALGVLFIMFILAPLIVVWYLTGSGLLGLITSILFICYVGNPECILSAFSDIIMMFVLPHTPVG